VTESPEDSRCAYCRRPLPDRSSPGRTPKYCRRSHRQRAYEARRRAARAELQPGHVIVAQRELDRLHDRLYALEAALDDVATDLADAGLPGTIDVATVREDACVYAAALAHLREAAEDLRGLLIEPVTA
jgi:hypothetical protein